MLYGPNISELVPKNDGGSGDVICQANFQKFPERKVFLSVCSLLRMGDTVLPDEQEQKPSLLYRVRSSPSFTLAAICLAVFNDVFLFEVVSQPMFTPQTPLAERIFLDHTSITICAA